MITPVARSRRKRRSTALSDSPTCVAISRAGSRLLRRTMAMIAGQNDRDRQVPPFHLPKMMNSVT
jgi:hypothetical protein